MAPELTHILEAMVPPPLLAVEFDTIVFLVVVVVSLLGRLFGKKDPPHAEEWIDGDEADEARQRRSGQGQAEASGLDWEAEMRRLLEGREPEPKRAPAAAPPPLPAEPAPVYRQPAVFVPSIVSPPVNALATAEAEFRKAKELKAQAAAKIAEVGRLPAPGQQVKRRGRSASAEFVVGQLRGRKTARQAIIASAVLGQPKGLE